jgi:hypothetical protein
MRLDFRVEMDLDLQCRVGTLLTTRILNGTLSTSFYLIPPTPSLEGIIVGSFLGHFLVMLRNNYDVPLHGSIVVGLVRDPTSLNDIGFMNFLLLKPRYLFNLRIEDPLSWSNELTIDPYSGASVTIFESHLKPDTRYALVALWEPLFDEIPYKSVFRNGSTTSESVGTIVLDQDAVEAVQDINIIYHLVRDFGYLGNMNFTATEADQST